MNKEKILFMGTPDFASASLQALIDNGYDICGVFTQPDKPKGRGMDLVAPPVKTLAENYGIPVYQFAKLRDGTAFKAVKSLSPDLIVVVAYGRILPTDIIEFPKYGTINVHGSLLPKYRGSAPIQRAVINGDTKTGVTIMYLSEKMDEGDTVKYAETEIGEYDTSGDVFERLKFAGAGLLIETLPEIFNGTAVRTPQNHDEASYAPPIDKNEGEIDFSKSQRTILKHVYGMQPWPVAFFIMDGQRVKVFACEYTDNITECEPGTIVSAGNAGIEVSCADNRSIMLTEIQMPGKKRVRVADYLRGNKIEIGKRI